MESAKITRFRARHVPRIAEDGRTCNFPAEQTSSFLDIFKFYREHCEDAYDTLRTYLHDYMFMFMNVDQCYILLHRYGYSYTTYVYTASSVLYIS